MEKLVVQGVSTCVFQGAGRERRWPRTHKHDLVRLAGLRHGREPHDVGEEDGDVVVHPGDSLTEISHRIHRLNDCPPAPVVILCPVPLD